MSISQIQGTRLLKPSLTSTHEERQRLERVIDQILSCKSIADLCITAYQAVSPHYPQGGSWEIEFGEEIEDFGVCCNLDFATFEESLAQRDPLIRNFNSQEGVFKPTLRIKTTSEGASQARLTPQKLQSRGNGKKRTMVFSPSVTESGLISQLVFRIIQVIKTPLYLDAIGKINQLSMEEFAQEIKRVEFGAKQEYQLIHRQVCEGGIEWLVLPFTPDTFEKYWQHINYTPHANYCRVEWKASNWHPYAYQKILENSKEKIRPQGDKLLEPSTFSNPKDKQRLQKLIDQILSCKVILALCMTAYRTSYSGYPQGGSWKIQFGRTAPFGGCYSAKERTITLCRLRSDEQVIFALVFEIINCINTKLFLDVRDKIHQLSMEEFAEKTEEVEFGTVQTYQLIHRQVYREEGIQWLTNPYPSRLSTFEEMWQAIKYTAHADDIRARWKALSWYPYTYQVLKDFKEKIWQ